MTAVKLTKKQLEDEYVSYIKYCMELYIIPFIIKYASFIIIPMLTNIFKNFPVAEVTIIVDCVNLISIVGLIATVIALTNGKKKCKDSERIKKLDKTFAICFVAQIIISIIAFNLFIFC